MIRNLIFDVGDVLFSYRWDAVLRESGLRDEEILSARDEIFCSEIWNEGLDMGIMTTEDALAAYRLRCPHFADTAAYMLAHGPELAVPRPEIYGKMMKLKEKGYRIYLLSNYSEDLFRQHTQGREFMKALDGAVVSYQVKMIKPDEGIYRALLEKYDLDPEECFFMDDRAENIEAGKRLGFHGRQITSREMLGELLDGFLAV